MSAIKWTDGPEGQTAEFRGCNLRISHRLDNGSFAYVVHHPGDVNQTRGEEKDVATAKTNAIAVALRLSPPNVAQIQIEQSRKTEGTSDWHSVQWYDKLIAYALRSDISNVLVHFRDFANYTPNRVNIQTLRDYIAGLSDDVMPTDLKAALLAHLDAILGLKFKGEYKHHFSRSMSGVRAMRDVSAASCFQSSFRQAVDYHKAD